MSIDIEIGNILSNEDAEHLAAAAAKVSAAMHQVEQAHPAYNWVWTDEIICRGCDKRLEVPYLASNKVNADLAFERHLAEETDIILEAH